MVSVPLLDARVVLLLDAPVVLLLVAPVVLLLDAPVETGMARARKRGELDRFEREAQAFFQRIRETYLERATEMPGRYHVVNAALPLEQVSESVSALLTALAKLPVSD